ncbi:MAG: FtsK/SpoIIIE domain-containing protein, partial [Actinoallomurus sp.]
VRTGHDEPTAFQAARVGRPRTDRAASGPPVRVALRRIETLGRSATEADRSDDGAGGRTDLSDLVDAIRSAAEDAGLTAPPRPWLPPLPEQVSLGDLRAPDAPGPVTAVLGLADRPSAQTQEPFVLDLERTGPVAIAGMARAGRSTALRTLAASLAGGASPADLHLYALDCGNQALAALAALPHCGAVVDGADPDRVERLLSALHAEIARRQRVLAAGGHGSLAEQRATADEPLPHVVVLLDRLEAFFARYAERDGGRMVDRVEELLRTGPGAGVTMVVTTDRSGFHHRVSSAVAARLVLRQATPDDVAAFGLDPRTTPRRMPPGRALWTVTGEEVQVALVQPDGSGATRTGAIERLSGELADRWKDLPPARLPRRVDPLPEEISHPEAEALRLAPRPHGPSVCTPVVGGDHLGPIDVDLAAAGSAFLVCGPQRSGRSTALAAIVSSLTGRTDGDLPVLVIAPRPSPLRDLAGTPGVLDVLTGDPADMALRVSDAAVTGPVALVVDDAELLGDHTLTEALESFTRTARDDGSVLVAAATTDDVLANPYRGWIAAVRRPRSGLLLNPATHVDGEVFGLRLARSLAGGWPPGRALLVRRGEITPAQLISQVSRQTGRTP